MAVTEKMELLHLLTNAVPPSNLDCCRDVQWECIYSHEPDSSSTSAHHVSPTSILKEVTRNRTSHLLPPNIHSPSSSILLDYKLVLMRRSTLCQYDNTAKLFRLVLNDRTNTPKKNAKEHELGTRIHVSCAFYKLRNP
jgi:hypothetical protein